jgi:hypothetical protein
MKTIILLWSEELTKEDLRLLFQAIRDCEQANFPEKLIGIFASADDLTTAECEEIIGSIKPPFKYGPRVFGKKQ